MKYTPVGLIQYDALLARCASLARQRPDFAEAFSALMEAEDLELFEYWNRVKPQTGFVVVKPQTQLLIEG